MGSARLPFVALALGVLAVAFPAPAIAQDPEPPAHLAYADGTVTLERESEAEEAAAGLVLLPGDRPARGRRRRRRGRGAKGPCLPRAGGGDEARGTEPAGHWYRGAVPGCRGGACRPGQPLPRRDLSQSKSVGGEAEAPTAAPCTGGRMVPPTAHRCVSVWPSAKEKFPELL